MGEEAYGAGMKHVTMADKSLLVGDDAADTLVEYAALIARLNSGDSVTLRAVGTDGEEVMATFLINSGTVLVAQSTFSNLPEPDNAEHVAYMRSRIAQFDGSGEQTTQTEDPLPTAE
jgi:hypothetical protein